MSKAIKSILSLSGIIAVSWWLGGMMYFIMVTKHFRDEEQYENATKNMLAYLHGTSGRTVVDERKSAGRSIKPSAVPREANQFQQDPNSRWKSYN